MEETNVNQQDIPEVITERAIFYKEILEKLNSVTNKAPFVEGEEVSSQDSHIFLSMAIDRDVIVNEDTQAMPSAVQCMIHGSTDVLQYIIHHAIRTNPVFRKLIGNIFTQIALNHQE